LRPACSSSSSPAIDVLMITYNRPQYTELALRRLLETCDPDVRVWIWHNGTDAATLDVVKAMLSHPRVHRFYHSPENRKLREPTNWLWKSSTGQFLSKVDDDCLMPEGWADTLRRAHADVPRLGVVGCWRFPDEDFEPELAQRKIESLPGGHRVMKNMWVEGSGYLMKRQCVEQQGLLGPDQSFSDYCIRLAARGWVNGWYFPLLYQEHMDDPRSPRSLLRSDEDLKRYLPLSALKTGVTTLEQWQAQLRRSARLLQQAAYNPTARLGWRRVVGAIRRRVSGLMGVTSGW
jgi:GT2 family glycosyltransferase